MSALREWLLGITAAALAVALAQALTPEGTVKKVGRLVGGLVLLLAVTAPLKGFSPVQVTLPGGGGLTAAEAAKGGEDVMKTLIAQKVGAYIVDKGAQLGCPCTAWVTVVQDENGWPVPWSVELTGRWEGQGKRELSQVIEEELDIPAERQSFREETP